MHNLEKETKIMYHIFIQILHLTNFFCVHGIANAVRQALRSMISFAFKLNNELALPHDTFS